MAYAITKTNRARAAYLAFARAIAKKIDAAPRVQAIRALNALTDAELSRRGTTRATEARRIVGPARFV